MGIRLLGKKKVHSKEKDQDFFFLEIDFPASDSNMGRQVESKFVSEDVFNSVKRDMYGKEIDFEWTYMGRYPSVKAIKILN